MEIYYTGGINNNYDGGIKIDDSVCKEYKKCCF